MDNAYQVSPLYGLTTVVVIIVVSMLLKKAPQMNTFVVVVVGLLVGYVFLIVMNSIFPLLANNIRIWRQYLVFQGYETTDNMSYIYVYPPILAVFVIFVALLYNRNI